MLGICPNTLDSWIKKGAIPSFRIEGRTFIPRAALEELMQPRVPQPARRPTLTTQQAWEADHPKAV